MAFKANQSAAGGAWELEVLLMPPVGGGGNGKETAHRLGPLVSQPGDVFQILQMVNK